MKYQEKLEPMEDGTRYMVSWFQRRTRSYIIQGQVQFRKTSADLICLVLMCNNLKKNSFHPVENVLRGRIYASLYTTIKS